MDMDDVRRFLDPDEPDYAAAALALGPDALPHLAELAAGDDVMLASKATYLAGLVGGEESRAILERAADHDDPTVRVAAAGTVQNLEGDVALDLARRLLGDRDVGVRRVTVESATHLESSDVRERLRELVGEDDDELIRSMAPGLRD